MQNYLLKYRIIVLFYITTILLIINFAIAPCLVRAQEIECDKELFTSNKVRNRYRLRQDDTRCEGIYIQEVRNASFQIVSFTAKKDVEAFKNERIHVWWVAPHSDEIQPVIQLRAQGLRYRLSYRMDAISKKPPFIWPMDVLQSEGISGEDIGIYGVVNMMVNNQDRKVFLPLFVTGYNFINVEDYNYTFLIRPGLDIHEVFLTLTRIDEFGRYSEKSIWEDQALNYGNYPKGEVLPIVIPVDYLQPGLYILEIGVQYMDNFGSDTKNILFYHSGR